ncbi:MAG TPA: hypothetical protein VK700_03870 [Steroidobacteraceae bacterium]|jgi:hypothetical protein|nr:hypothetical protein [Steroidobacteraceae bacterium]
MTTDVPAAPDAGKRRREVRRSAVLLGIIAAVFYVGFIIMMIWRASR